MFKRQDARVVFDAHLFPSFVEEPEGARPLSSYTNNPLQEKLVQKLVPELRGYLLEKLPDYMVPSSFIMLDSMPLTPNGKVNRQALPDQDGLRPQLETTYVAPKTEVERAIAGIWQEALHLEKVGLHDNFFDLGGHSLLMVQVQSRLQEIFEREISLIDMFKCPTISLMTKYFRSKQSEQPSLQESQERAETRLQSLNRQRQLRQKQRASVRQFGAGNE
jgi:acyl carrier protein